MWLAERRAERVRQPAIWVKAIAPVIKPIKVSTELTKIGTTPGIVANSSPAALTPIPDESTNCVTTPRVANTSASVVNLFISIINHSPIKLLSQC
jgi:hypothetical protein